MESGLTLTYDESRHFYRPLIYAYKKLVEARAFRFAIRIDSPIHFKRIDSNRFVL